MRKNHFEEQFEDSEANHSEAGPPRAEDRTQGEPIQLLKVLRTGKI